LEVTSLGTNARLRWRHEDPPNRWFFYISTRCHIPESEAAMVRSV
jgi:hypothetical protein